MNVRKIKGSAGLRIRGEGAKAAPFLGVVGGSALATALRRSRAVSLAAALR